MGNSSSGAQPRFENHLPPHLRAEIGFAVEGVTREVLTALAKEAKVREIAPARCMVAEFPWRNTFSFVVGYLKVDPALARHREAHGYAKVEALSLNLGDTILYMQPIRRGPRPHS